MNLLTLEIWLEVMITEKKTRKEKPVVRMLEYADKIWVDDNTSNDSV